jgi:hypothetical protein
MVRGRVAARVLAVLLTAAGAMACGDQGHDLHRAFNSRDTGSWVPLGRAESEDGALAVHVAAAHPEYAEEIAYHIVRQNFASSAAPIRVIVDPMVGEGERRVYRWDGQHLAEDTSPDGLPPRVHRPDADGAEASPH